MAKPTIILVSGVSGSGKTTIGELLADKLGWDYAEADDFHPPANVAKMKAGHPLTDDDRMPWLRDLATWIDGRLDSGAPAVVTCSALKRSYRDLLIDGRDGVRLVFLEGDRDLIADRIRRRKGHFFNAELLDSQFRDLEPPRPDEDALHVPVTDSPDELTDEIITTLNLN